MKAGLLRTLIAAFALMQLAAPFTAAQRLDVQVRPAAEAAAPLEECNDAQCG